MNGGGKDGVHRRSGHIGQMIPLEKMRIPRPKHLTSPNSQFQLPTPFLGSLQNPKTLFRPKRNKTKKGIETKYPQSPSAPLVHPPRTPPIPLLPSPPSTIHHALSSIHAPSHRIPNPTLSMRAIRLTIPRRHRPLHLLRTKRIPAKIRIHRLAGPLKWLNKIKVRGRRREVRVRITVRLARERCWCGMGRLRQRIEARLPVA